MIKQVQCINGEHIPDTPEIKEDLEQRGVSTHCATELYSVSLDEKTPFIVWLQEIGFKFEPGTHTWIGIWGT